MSSESTTIILPVLNGQKYIRQCLAAVLAQTEQDFELIIIDDGSTDQTKDIIQEFVLKFKIENLKFSFFENKKRLGPWGAFEKVIKTSESKYCILLSVDVILDKDFIKNAIAVMESDEQIGCLQAKIFQYEQKGIMNNELGIRQEGKVIDTVGFQIHKSRRITNLGHGQIDTGQFNEQKEIFAVEGAVPIFRREAFLDCGVPVPTLLRRNCVPESPATTFPRGSTSGDPPLHDLRGREVVDHDMFWYGDDLDLGWRMNLFGWKQIFAPNVIAYHDRSTTKGMSYHWWDYFARIRTRRQIPIGKRRLDWRNKRLARIKNDQWPNIWRHLPQILLRELSELGYILLAEPAVLLEIPKLISLLPKMLDKRKAIMARAKRSAAEMRQWFV